MPQLKPWPNYRSCNNVSMCKGLRAARGRFIFRLDSDASISRLYNFYLNNNLYNRWNDHEIRQ